MAKHPNKLPERIIIHTGEESKAVLVNRIQYLDAGKDPNLQRARKYENLSRPQSPLIPRIHYANGYIESEVE